MNNPIFLSSTNVFGKEREYKDEYGDFRDWFILEEEDKPKAHLVDAYLYLNEYYLYNFKMPITIEKLMVYSTFCVSEKIWISEMNLIIPEMNLIFMSSMKNSSWIKKRDTVNLDFEFNYGG